MNNDLKKVYHTNNIKTKDITSPYGNGKVIYNINRETNKANTTSFYNYLYTVSNNIDIFRNVISHVSEISDKVLSKKLNEFIDVFMSILTNLSKSSDISNFLPPLTIHNEENLVFLEWIFKDFRIGFSLEKEKNESMWFMVTNKNLEEFSISGDLEPENYYEVIIKVLKYVLENS